MAIEVALVGPERQEEMVLPLLVAMGLPPSPERSERARRLRELVQRIVARDDGAVVGGLASYDFTMTTPGGAAGTAGLTMVGVLPTHRRRGVLTAMLREHVDDVRARGLAVGALWASEGSIYGRFGYGVAALAGEISAPTARFSFVRDVAPFRARLLDEAASIAAFQPIYERVRPSWPGLLSRSDVWWSNRRVGDYEPGRPPLQRVLLEVDGRPDAYAIYRLTDTTFASGMTLETDVQVVEAIGATPEATAAIWRYLGDLDLVRRVRASYISPTHPLLHLVREPRRLELRLGDALWVRLFDVDAALKLRAFDARERITFALEDAFCPWNEGIYAIEAGEARRAQGSPELRLDASALASLYLGGTTATELADAGAIRATSPDALARADALFRGARYPWTPEMF